MSSSNNSPYPPPPSSSSPYPPPRRSREDRSRRDDHPRSRERSRRSRSPPRGRHAYGESSRYGERSRYGEIDRHRGGSRSSSRRRERSPSIDTPDGSWSPTADRGRPKAASGWDVPPIGGIPPPQAAFDPQQQQQHQQMPPQQQQHSASGTSFPGMHPARMAQLSGAPPTPQYHQQQQQQQQQPSYFQPHQTQNSNRGGGNDDRRARRIYCGGLPPHTTDPLLSSFFNQAMLQRYPQMPPGPCVISIFLNLPKRFGFVEFRTIEETTDALALDGISFEGGPLKLRRPSDYVPPPGASQQPMYTNNSVGVTGISNQVPEGPNKVFVGGLPHELSEVEVKELLEAYGALGSFHLPKDRDTQQSKGFGFFTYADPSVTDTAVEGLNGIQMLGKTLTVKRSVPKGQHQDNTVTSMASMVPLIPEQLIPTEFVAASPIVCLTQMITAADLVDDEEYKEILEDIHHECNKFGAVKQVVIPRPQPDRTVPDIGKVFVVFASIDDAKKGKEALEGRKFAERTVLAHFVPEAEFARKQL